MNGDVFLLVAALVVYFILRVVVKVATSSLGKIGLEVLIYRHFTGMHYHGEERTDAGWWRHGQQVYHRSGRASKWEHRPRGQRALWRTGVTLALIATVIGIFLEPALTERSAISLLVYVVACTGFILWQRWSIRHHKRDVLNPLTHALATTLKISHHDIRRRLTVSPAGLATSQGEIGSITLPEDYAATVMQQNAVEHVVNSHLPVAATIDWRMAGTPKQAIILHDTQPPTEVPWADVLADMRALAAGDIYLGKDRRKQAYIGSFNGADDPHWGFSMGSGRGKSNMLGVICAQILHQDPRSKVTVVDPKRSSLKAMIGGIPGVTMANNPNDAPAMWDAIIDFREEMERRSEESEDRPDEAHKYPINLLVIDELNMFNNITNAAWKRARAQDKSLDKQPDIWNDIAACLWTGRFVRCHVILVGQRLDDKATGGIGLRDSLGLRGLAGFRSNQWKMLVDTTPIPISQKGKGRVIFTDGENEEWVQVVRGDVNRDYSALHDYAMEHRQGMSVRPEASARGSRADALALTSGVTDRGTDELPSGVVPLQGVVDSADILTGLEEGAAYVGLSRSAFEKARQRTESDGRRGRIDGEFRVGNQPAWVKATLDDWQKARPRANR